jgi:hypothetical protein
MKEVGLSIRHSKALGFVDSFNRGNIPVAIERKAISGLQVVDRVTIRYSDYCK